MQVTLPSRRSDRIGQALQRYLCGWGWLLWFCAYQRARKRRARVHWLEASLIRAGGYCACANKSDERDDGGMRTVSSATNGSYLMALLLPGLYEVEVTQSGFKKVHLTNVHVSVAETTTLDVHLEIGSVSGRIAVEAIAEQLQSESSTLRRVTEGDRARAPPSTAYGSATGNSSWSRP